MKPGKLVTATLGTGLAVTLAACGAGSASHVVARLSPPTTSASTTTTAAGGSSGSSSVPGSAGAGATTTAPSDALNPQTLDQVAADLGALDNSLSTANSDLNHPQGDS